MAQSSKEQTPQLTASAAQSTETNGCGRILTFPQLLKCLVYPQLLGLVRVLGLTAFFSNRAARTAFAAVPGRRNVFPVLEFRVLPAQTQLSSLCAGITVVFGVIRHVLHSPDLLLEAAALLLFIVGRLYEA